MPKTIKESIEKYGYDKVKASALYLSTQKKLTSPRAYFLKCLENDWAKDVVVKDKKSLEDKQIETVVENTMDLKNAKKYYENLSLEEQSSLEKEVYLEYIKECGQETKIQKMAFKVAKNNLIYKYIEGHKLYFQKEISIVKEANDERSKVLTDRMAFNNYVDESIHMYKIGFDLSEEKIIKIKKEIFLALISKFILKELTIEEIDRTVAEKLGG